MGRPFTFDRRWVLPAPPAEVWAVLVDTEAYPRWWPWLERFEADGLRRGATARFVVRPPLPYRLQLDAVVEEVVPERLVAARIEGDLAGRARLELAPWAGDSSDARLVWSLVVHRPSLRRVERVARPAMVWGHDAVVARGLRQFRSRALASRCRDR